MGPLDDLELDAPDEIEELLSDIEWMEEIREGIGLKDSDVVYSGSFSEYTSSIKGVKIA